MGWVYLDMCLMVKSMSVWASVCRFLQCLMVCMCNTLLVSVCVCMGDFTSVPPVTVSMCNYGRTTQVDKNPITPPGHQMMAAKCTIKHTHPVIHPYTHTHTHTLTHTHTHTHSHTHYHTITHTCPTIGCVLLLVLVGQWWCGDGQVLR